MTGSGAWTPEVTIVAHDVAGAGGMERQLRELICGLLDVGASVIVVSRTLGLPDHPGLRWHRVSAPARPFVVAYPWFAVVASLMLLRLRKGVLHVTGAIVFNRADVCTVHFLHSGDGVVRASRGSAAYRLHARLARLFGRAVERVLYRSEMHTRILVAVTPRAADELREAFSNRSRSVRIIRHAVDAERFRPDRVERVRVRRELGLTNDVKVALFLGSEWEGKGVAIVVDALRLAPDWDLIVVGSGDGERLMHRAASISVSSRVRLVGETAAPERYYAAADAFVLPSASETFSLAALEAAAAELPVVATDVGIVREIVEAGGGLLVERNPASVAAALASLAGSETRQLFGQRARAYAVGMSWSAVVDEHMTLYSEVAGALGRESVSGVAESAVS